MERPGYGTKHMALSGMRNETAETCTSDGESPVVESAPTPAVWLPSSMGHVKSRMNLRGPPRKTKYS